jgi:hypothetical protein
LILETAKFKYPFFWADLGDLYDAIFDLDAEINRQRGLLVFSKKNDVDSKEFGLSGCDLLTSKKLEQAFLGIFKGWLQETNFKEITFDNGLPGGDAVAELFNAVPESIMTPWLRFMILNQTYIERENLLKIDTVDGCLETINFDIGLETSSDKSHTL